MRPAVVFGRFLCFFITKTGLSFLLSGDIVANFVMFFNVNICFDYLNVYICSF